MNDDARKNLALFRYQLIAALLRLTERGELQPALKALAKQVHKHPDGSVRRYSIRTLERYLACYRKDGLEGLMPEVRSDYDRPRALPQAVIDRAIALRREQPARTVEQLIKMLETENLALPDTLKRSTLAAHLQKAGVPRNAPPAKLKRNFQRYGANEVNEIWQCDVCDSLRIPDPDSNGQMRVARLVGILDDKSRYICQASFYFRENLPVLEDTLKKAITRHGTPAIFYADNAKIFRSRQLSEIAATLSFEVRHSKAFFPQGRGKLERFFGYVERSFRPEAELCLKQGKIAGLEDLNRYFAAWLETMYHQRVHGTLKKRPADVFATHGPLRLVTPEVLKQAFLWSHSAKADKTACISVQGNTYEVEPILAGQKIELRYDPFDLSEIQVRWEGKQYANAIPLKMRRHTDKRVAPPSEPEPSPGPPSSFLDQLVGDLRQRETSGITYGREQEGTES
jgi:transposase InsO family protein